MSRRDFSALTGAAALALFAAKPEGLAAAAGLQLGMCSPLKRATFLKAAGADFLEATVQALLVPDASDEAFAKRQEALRACPLSVPVCNGFIRRKDLLCVGPKANHDNVIRHVTVSITRAEKAGVNTIVFGSTGARKIPDGWNRERAMDQFVAVLKRMGPIAADHGVTIAVEPLNEKECNFINRIGDVAAVVAGVGYPSVRGVADLYHMILGGDTPDDLRKAVAVVHHVELADPTRGRALPAPGAQDFRAFFRVLRGANFAGTMSMEGHAKDSDVAGAFTEVRKQWATA